MIAEARDSRLHTGLGALIATNGLTVSALYWAQAMVRPAAEQFGASLAVQLMPGATLAGYAAGVALLASSIRDLTSPRGLGTHAALLVGALGLAAAAPAGPIAMVAFLLVGVGCALTQRLLACATTASGPARQSQAIGWIIAAGLGGIMLARALVPSVTAWLGWRSVLALASIGTALCGAAATFAAARIDGSRHHTCRAVPPAIALWRGRATLRRAALQQALVFASFNGAWALFPRLLVGSDACAPALMGAVAGLGAVAALVSGRLCARHDRTRVAGFGAAAVALGFALLTLRLGTALDTLAMAALDAGTQVALVANQSRAQALDPDPAIRGRLAAIVTTIGFAGGAVGAALGNLLF